MEFTSAVLWIGFNLISCHPFSLPTWINYYLTVEKKKKEWDVSCINISTAIFLSSPAWLSHDAFLLDSLPAISNINYCFVIHHAHFSSSYCPYTDKKEELPCELGYYSTGNASSCEICPPGYECPFQDQAVRYEGLIAGEKRSPQS